MRERLERVGQDLADADRERFDDFGQDLHTLEQQVRARTDEAGQTYRDVIDRFDREIRDVRDFHRPDAQPEADQ